MTQCPACDRAMKEVSVRANPGTLIILDQCESCGGIWCDKWELFPVRPDEALRLDPLDQRLLNAPVGPKKFLCCPRCRDRLAIFHEPLLPTDIQLQRCRRCEGIWLNRGQFVRYKSFQRKKRADKLDGDTKLRQLEQACQDPKSWVTTGVRGIFAYPRAVEDSNAELQEIMTKGTFRFILQTLLRLVLPF